MSRQNGWGYALKLVVDVNKPPKKSGTVFTTLHFLRNI